MPLNILNQLRTCLLVAIVILSSCSQNGLSHQENQLADSLLIRFSKITPKESLSSDSLIIQTLDNLKKGFNETQQCRYYFAKARHIRNQQRYNKSELVSDSALYIIRTSERPIKDAGLLMDVLTIKSDNNMALRKYNLSGYYALLALEVADSLSDCKKASFHTRVALSKYFLKDYDAALAYYQTALNAIEKCDTPLSNIMFKAQIMNNIGLAYLKKNDFISAENIFKKTLEYIVQIKIIHPKAIKDCEMSSGVVKGNLSRCYYAEHRVNQAIALLDDNIMINGQPGYDNYDALTSVIFKGDILINEKRHTELNDVIRSGEKILTQASYPLFQSKIERLKQTYYASVGKYELANKAAEATIHLSDSLHEAELVAASNDMLTLSNQVRQEKTFRQLFTEKQQERIRLYVAIGLLLLFIFISFLLLLGFRNTRQLNSRLKQLNKDIQDKNKALQLADAEKNRILTIVAHDLRSPVASIHALNNMLLNGINETNPGYESHKIIEVASTNAMEMADELLFVTNINQHKSELNLQKVKLNELLSTSCALQRLKAKEKNQDILLSLPEQTITATVDVVKISRAINNLLVNAGKFSERGKHIKVTLAQEGAFATIAIEDEGIGIDEQEQELIFEMFSKVRKRGTDGESTFGLGLSITKHIIEQHKGYITLKSKPGKGSTFTLHIPVQ